MAFTRHIHLLFILSCFSLLSLNVSAAKFYKWIDDEGNTHFSDKTPETNGEAELIRINSSAPLPSGKSPAKFSLSDIEEAEKAKATQAEAEKKDKQLQEKCKRIQSSLSVLEKGGRIATIDDKGERQFIDDNERQQRIKKSQDQLSKHCD